MWPNEKEMFSKTYIERDPILAEGYRGRSAYTGPETRMAATVTRHDPHAHPSEGARWVVLASF